MQRSIEYTRQRGADNAFVALQAMLLGSLHMVHRLRINAMGQGDKTAVESLTARFQELAVLVQGLEDVLGQIQDEDPNAGRVILTDQHELVQ